jgi:hypothetical protein
MKVHVGSTTVVAPGGKTLILPTGFKPLSVHFQVSPQNDVGSELSTGFSNGAMHRAASSFSRGSVERTRRSTTEAITHYRVVGGTYVKTLGGKPKTDGFDTPGLLGLQFDTCTQTTIVDYIVYGE